MSFILTPASSFSLEALSHLFTQAFADYYLPTSFSTTALSARCAAENVSLHDSYVAMGDGAPVGIALMARRGQKSRLAGMGVIPAWRGKGVARALAEQVLRDARNRGDSQMLLEVIGQNEIAIALYRRLGFVVKRKLVGYRRPPFEVLKVKAEPVAIDILARAALREVDEGLLPWQLDGLTLAGLTYPFQAFELNGAWALLLNGTETVTMRSVLVPRHQRAQGLGTFVLQAAAAHFPGKDVVVPPIMPEELTRHWFERLGFEPQETWQYEMEREL